MTLEKWGPTNTFNTLLLTAMSSITKDVLISVVGQIHALWKSTRTCFTEKTPFNKWTNVMYVEITKLSHSY